MSTTTTTTTQSPCARLEASRAVIRIHLRSTALGSGARRPTDALTYMPYVVGLIAALSQSGTLSDRLLAWWKTLPFTQELEVVGDALNAQLLPVAQRYPGRLVVGALVVGAAIAWIRPWRWFNDRSAP